MANTMPGLLEEKKGVHPSTLAAVYGGLKALQTLRPQWVDSSILQIIVTQPANFATGFTKIASDGVDANLLMLGVPFGLVELENPLLINTIKKIEEDLKPGGLYRYLGDTITVGNGFTDCLAGLVLCVGRKRTKAEKS